MAATMKAAIAFGLLHVPISLQPVFKGLDDKLPEECIETKM